MAPPQITGRSIPLSQPQQQQPAGPDGQARIDGSGSQGAQQQPAGPQQQPPPRYADQARAAIKAGLMSQADLNNLIGAVETGGVQDARSDQELRGLIALSQGRLESAQQRSEQLGSSGPQTLQQPDANAAGAANGNAAPVYRNVPGAGLVLVKPEAPKQPPPQVAANETPAPAPARSPKAAARTATRAAPAALAKGSLTEFIKGGKSFQGPATSDASSVGSRGPAVGSLQNGLIAAKAKDMDGVSEGQTADGALGNHTKTGYQDFRDNTLTAALKNGGVQVDLSKSALPDAAFSDALTKYQAMVKADPSKKNDKVDAFLGALDKPVDANLGAAGRTAGAGGGPTRTNGAPTKADPKATELKTGDPKTGDPKATETKQDTSTEKKADLTGLQASPGYKQLARQSPDLAKIVLDRLQFADPEEVSKVQTSLMDPRFFNLPRSPNDEKAQALDNMIQLSDAHVNAAMSQDELEMWAIQSNIPDGPQKTALASLLKMPQFQQLTDSGLKKTLMNAETAGDVAANLQHSKVKTLPDSAKDALKVIQNSDMSAAQKSIAASRIISSSGTNKPGDIAYDLKRVFQSMPFKKGNEISKKALILGGEDPFVQTQLSRSSGVLANNAAKLLEGPDFQELQAKNPKAAAGVAVQLVASNGLESWRETNFLADLVKDDGFKNEPATHQLDDVAFAVTHLFDTRIGVRPWVKEAWDKFHG